MSTTVANNCARPSALFSYAPTAHSLYFTWEGHWLIMQQLYLQPVYLRGYLGLHVSLRKLINIQILFIHIQRSRMPEGRLLICGMLENALWLQLCIRLPLSLGQVRTDRVSRDRRISTDVSSPTYVSHRPSRRRFCLRKPQIRLAI